MLHIRTNKLGRLFTLSIFLLCHSKLWAMDLNDAVQVALNNPPEIRKAVANQNKLSQEAIADSQLPDPVISGGIMNLPTDTFDFNQEPMSQIQIGLQQSFPKGRSLKYARERKEHLAAASEQNEEIIRIEIVRNVRLYWFDLLFWKQVQVKTKEQKQVFIDLLDVTESLLANNKAQQHDVIRAQLELSELEIRLTEIEKNISVAIANLQRWIGKKDAGHLFAISYPVLPRLMEYKALHSSLHSHPKLVQDNSYVSSAKSNVKWACEQYKPGITTGVAYGIRQGRNIDGSKRPDFITATVKMDLPIFRASRQDRRVMASKDDLIEFQERQSIDYKELTRMLDEQYSMFREYSKNLTLYKEKLTPQAKQYSQATMLAYKNGNSEFSTLARSYVRELDTKIATIKTRIERDKAHINLLYLMGNSENV